MATNYPCNSTLTPRRYQEEIFIKAQESNVIAALDTGSGKTFISSMLMRWMSSREDSRGKVIAFLVPKVPLVEQQADFIAKQTPLKVCRLHGMLEIDMTDHLRWRKVFAQHDVVVMTGALSYLAYHILG
jgi:endoribonuclease Dicer